MRARSKVQGASISMLILYGILIVALLVLTLAGCRLYKVFTNNRMANERERAVLSYLQGKVSSLDVAGAIMVEDGPQGDSDMLVLAEEGTDYETRIFIYDGELMELFTQTSAPTDPDDAEVIAQEDCLKITLQSEGALMQVTTSQGTACMAIRSAKGGTDEREN
ncbi:MAG: DUF4860 domain-containing protein [Eubacterium sp.]|nr:DUF4860 domain-containing protein [Eubacterium sp.]